MTMPFLLTSLLLTGAPVQGDEAPRLVVLISVDQMIPEQLTRLEPWLSGGLGEFLRRGRVYRAAELSYGTTSTGPGHATLATGTQPSTHGIVGNGFLDRVQREYRYCVGDDDERGVCSSDEGGRGTVSPRTLAVGTLGDHMKAAAPGSKVIAVTGKDRSSVTMGGHEADAVFWWNRVGGGFMTSTYYAEQLPAWVVDWNYGWLDEFDGFVWSFSHGSALVGSGTERDDRPGESGYSLGGRTFPYRLPRVDIDGGAPRIAQYASMVFTTPLVDDFVVQLALQSVEHCELGADDVPDLLAVGLSACDTVGHAHGPYSMEVTDVLLRADAALGKLFAYLDETVGAERWVAALSADHGVLPLVESLRERGIDAVRLTAQDVERATRTVRDALEARFDKRVGVQFSDGLVLDPVDIERHGLDPVAVRAAARDALRSVPWVARAYTHDELLSEDASQLGDDPLKPLAARGVTPERGADVIVFTRPWHIVNMATGTTHGSPYPYDRRIPLAFLGPGFEPGNSYDPVDSVDVVPTLLKRLGIEPKTPLDGRVLR